MGFIEIFFISVGLSMDAVCVSMTNGMCYRKMSLKHYLYIALAFGFFQGFMPFIGYYAGSIFANQVEMMDHWLALIFLSFIGGKMILDSRKKATNNECRTSLTFKLLMVQAIATSIDALAVGISFAAMNVNIIVASISIAVCTTILSFVAVFVGKKAGTKLNSKAEIFGGSILIFIGLKIFIEHMFF